MCTNSGLNAFPYTRTHSYISNEEGPMNSIKVEKVSLQRLRLRSEKSKSAEIRVLAKWNLSFLCHDRILRISAAIVKVSRNLTAYPSAIYQALSANKVWPKYILDHVHDFFAFSSTHRFLWLTWLHVLRSRLRNFSRFGPSRIWSPRSKSASGSGPPGLVSPRGFGSPYFRDIYIYKMLIRVNLFHLKVR